MALTKVTTGGIKDGTITNDDISSSAAIPASKLDHGTSSNQLVRLTSDGKLPAVSGANLTGIETVTKSATAPSSPAAGDIWFDTVLNSMKVYNNTSWEYIGDQTGDYTIDYLIVAGGGAGGAGGGYETGGGAGAGGYLTGSNIEVKASTTYTMTVGAGGASTSTYSPGAIGSNSIMSGGIMNTITSVGGGGGSSAGGSATPGGSGGGGSNWQFQTGASGTSGQGNSGGTGSSNAGANGAGGGGGAGSSGGNSNISVGGQGGAGLSDNWTGATRWVAGGGGGSGNTRGYGQHGGGNGSDDGPYGGVGTVNTGGGGGGTHQNPYSATGGSGLLVIRYLGSQRGTGGVVTTSGGYTLHTFTTSSTYTA